MQQDQISKFQQFKQEVLKEHEALLLDLAIAVKKLEFREEEELLLLKHAIILTLKKSIAKNEEQRHQDLEKYDRLLDTELDHLLKPKTSWRERLSNFGGAQTKQQLQQMDQQQQQFDQDAEKLLTSKKKQ